MRKILVLLLFGWALLAALPGMACWVEDGGGGRYNSAWGQLRIDGAVSGQRLTAALPATAYLRLVRYNADRPITRIALQYRGADGAWTTFRELERVIESEEFLPLFGIDTLTAEMFDGNGPAFIRIYTTDGYMQNFSLDSTGDEGRIELEISPNRRPVFHE